MDGGGGGDGATLRPRPFGDKGKPKWRKKEKKHSVQRAQAHVQAKEEKKKSVLIENTGTENIKIANKIHTSAYNGRMAPKINELRIRES